MIKILATASMATMLLAGTAFAAETDGVVKNYDITTRMLTLDTGETFVVPADVEVADIASGDSVIISHEDNSTDASAVVVSE